MEGLIEEIDFGEYQFEMITFSDVFRRVRIPLMHSRSATSSWHPAVFSSFERLMRALINIGNAWNHRIHLICNS